MSVGAFAQLCRRVAVDPQQLPMIVGAWDRPALLEGGAAFGEAGRWSMYAAEPRLEFEARDGAGWIRGEGQVSWSLAGDPLDRLVQLLDDFGLADPHVAPDPDAPPFRGGVIGFFGYDLAPSLERLPRKAPPDSRIPTIRFALYDTVVALDHATGVATLLASDLLGEGEAAARQRLYRWARRLERARPQSPLRTRLAPGLHGHITRDGYLDAVGQALEYIRAGDIFQVNLSQRFDAFGAIEPLDLYLALRSVSPAPFAAFLAWNDLAVVSASPEWFLKVRGDHVVTRPIKGTRPRGGDSDADARLIAELQTSPKDRAELTMIVDLERNDLGQVCRYGSVVVTEPLTVESYAQVHHLVATVEGRLHPGFGAVDLIRATFPGGSITGAPKIRAMEIIDELEPTRRSLYTGSVGYFGVGGASGFNIAIRTLLVEGDRVSFQVGGGIVADSVPEAEYDETLHKARGLRAVLESRGA